MEVGAVKQAFNNEVILLKKKLNQAKIQIIHKLTRKAKTLTEKKAPEKLKGKFSKKAESAVKEVLIIKKIKPRDIARFIVTHKGQLNEYLNKPTVDQDKACARLLLHKALQDKYKIIRERFSNISIEDLLMSRHERRKLKKEAREKKKDNKKGKKDNVEVEVEGDWNIEDIDMGDIQVRNESDDDSESSGDERNPVDDIGEITAEGESEHFSDESNSAKNKINVKNNNKSNVTHLRNTNGNDVDISEAESTESNKAVDLNDDDECSESDNDSIDNNVGAFVKISPTLVDNDDTRSKVVKIKENVNKKPQKQKQKDSNKNKNLKNKILTKNFNKKDSQLPVQENKVVDPFFITATGENYMSVAEPRQPDEVKDVHQQGNRKYRRAVMFGHVPKGRASRDTRPERDNTRFSKFDDSSGNYHKNNKFNGFEKPSQNMVKKFDNNSNRGNLYDRNSFMNKNINDETKPEKLHPSWEAKKRQSGILPFQGKKIVFDEG